MRSVNHGVTSGAFPKRTLFQSFALNGASVVTRYTDPLRTDGPPQNFLVPAAVNGIPAKS